MVARSSDSESDATIIFYRCFLFLSFFRSPHFLRRRKTDIPETFPHNRTFAILISSKCPLKQTGAENPKICTIFLAKSQTISTVVR